MASTLTDRVIVEIIFPITLFNFSIEARRRERRTTKNRRDTMKVLYDFNGFFTFDYWNPKFLLIMPSEITTTINEKF